MIEILQADKITKEHIAQALALDRISYDEIYHLDLETCEAYFRKNPLIYIMANDQLEEKGVAIRKWKHEKTLEEIPGFFHIWIPMKAQGFPAASNASSCDDILLRNS